MSANASASDEAKLAEATADASNKPTPATSTSSSHRPFDGPLGPASDAVLGVSTTLPELPPAAAARALSRNTSANTGGSPTSGHGSLVERPLPLPASARTSTTRSVPGWGATDATTSATRSDADGGPGSEKVAAVGGPLALLVR